MLKSLGEDSFLKLMLFNICGREEIGMRLTDRDSY